MSYNPGPVVLAIPDLDDGETHPGGIEPGKYTVNELVDLLRRHAADPAAIHFIADLMEL